MAMTRTPPPARPKKIGWLANQPLKRKMMLGIGLLLGLFLLANLLTLNSLHQQVKNRASATRTYEVLLQIGTLHRAAQTSQVSARGFMLSQSADQLEQFNHAIVELDDEISRLRGLITHNPLQQTRLDAVASIASHWRQEVIDFGINPMQRLNPAAPDASAEREHIRSSYRTRRTVHIKDLVAVLDQMAGDEKRIRTSRNQQLDLTLATTKAINALTILLGIALGIMVVRLTTQLVIRPLRRLTDQMTQLAEHNHDFEIRRLDRRDEVGEIARALQVFKQMSLDTEAQTWIRTQVSEISHTLLQATAHKDFAQWLINAIVPLCNAGIGVFYSFDDAHHRLDLLGSYGLHLKHRSADHYMPGEGLVGQCASERKPIILNHVPVDYLHIDSGSRDALPSHVAILPVLYRDTLIGVLELASFTSLTALQRQLLDELLPIAALILENLNQAVHTQDLLLRTQEQADELRLSELVMRQQKAILHQSNETLQAKTQELEEQSRRLMASDEELRIQAEELQESNEELREMTDNLNRQRYVLEDLQQETANKAAELARASQYKSEFLTNMSHELRTPLNSLLILSRGLAENDAGNLDAEQVESASIIHDAGNKLLRLINDILDLSKVEAGKMELVLDDLVITDLVTRLERTFTHVAAARNVRFAIDIEPGLPTLLRTDEGKLEQVANNLLSNAFKFTAEGSVDVHIGRPGNALEIPDTLHGQPLIALSIRDTGIGIPSDRLEAIFNAFEQVDAGTSRQFGGTGLGLALSRRMAHLLGGEILLHSEPGRGSQFTLLLPETPPLPDGLDQDSSHDDAGRFPQTPSAHNLPTEITDDQAVLQRGKAVVLVIGSDAGSRQSIRAILGADNIKTDEADSGGEALAQLAATRYECIVLDPGLPGMPGWEILSQLSRDAANRPPVVIYSGHRWSNTELQKSGNHTDAIVWKNAYSASQLLDEVHALLNRGDHPATRPAVSNTVIAALSGRRVMLVDDDMRNLFALSRVLRGWGMQVSQAQDGPKALKMLAEGNVPELMLMDIMMPGMDGYATMRAIREQSAFAAVPIIALTAKATRGDQEKCLEMGASDYLAKPIETGKLATMMCHWLQCSD